MAVEWGEVARHLFSGDYLEIRFGFYGKKSDEREIVFLPHGEPYRLPSQGVGRKMRVLGLDTGIALRCGGLIDGGHLLRRKDPNRLGRGRYLALIDKASTWFGLRPE